MPELPEVETIAQNLRSSLLYRTVVSFWSSDIRLRTTPDVTLLRQLPMCKLTAVHRRGKYLLFRFLRPYAQGIFTVLSHLGMSGRYLLRNHSDVPLPHTHVRLRFDHELELHYVDPRRFGSIQIYGVGEEATETIPEVSLLGPDPFDQAFHVRYLQEKLSLSKRPIKLWLLDQKNVAGLGNIYVLETLFLSHIHPERPASSLSLKEVTQLHRATLEILKKAIERRGTTLRDGGYVDAIGNQGQNQMALNTYGRKGLPCRVCNTKIVHRVQAQRSSYFCPVCQK